MSSQRYEGWNEAIFTIPVTRLREGLPISVEQHLVMRALWPDVLSPPALLANLSAFGLDKVWEEATHLVNSSQDFERYFALIKDASPINTIDENDARWAGSMMPILKLQRSCGGKFFAFLLQVEECASSSGQGITTFIGLPSYLEIFAGSLEVINLALVSFLQEVHRLIPVSSVEWTRERVKFRAQFARAAYDSTPEGLLRSRIDRSTKSIITVSKVLDQSRRNRVLMQQTQHVVAWIKAQEPYTLFNGHRLLVSQHGTEIMLAFCSYHPDYVKYLNDPNFKIEKEPGPFLTHQRYGPWHTDNAQDMRQLSVIVAAIGLLASQS